MELDLARLFAVLDRHKVAYVLIGGIAAVYHGSPFPTEDVDIAPQTDRANLARLAAALAELDARTLDFAERAAKVPVELQQLNKRSVHRAMEIMGARAAMRAGTEIQALAFTTEASRAYMSTFRRDGGSVKAQLDQRDTTFGDYRTKKE